MEDYREEIARRVGVQAQFLAILSKYHPPVAVYFNEAYIIKDDQLTKLIFPECYINEAKLLCKALLEDEVGE